MNIYFHRWWLIPLLLLLLLPLMVLLPIGWAQQGRQALEYSTPLSLSSGDRLLVRGRNAQPFEQTLVIRIDDRERPLYSDRVNLERVIPPGSFELQLTMGGLHTPSGRALQINRIRRIIVFQGAKDSGLEIEPLQILNPVSLPTGAIGWDLGPAGSALWPGFTATDLSYPGLYGAHLKAIDRGGRKQAVEGLTTDGIRGIEKLSLPLPRGRWFLTLWLRDPGEWEYLPHPQIRHLHANGQPLWSQNHTTDSWIRTIYLRGRSRESRPDDDAWSLFGERPSERISFMVDVGDDGLQLTFGGDQPEAGFLAAALAEPGKNYPTRQQVEGERARWWRNNWRIADWPEQPITDPALLARQGKITAAPDTTASLVFDLLPGRSVAAPTIQVEAPALNALRLPTELRWGQWHLRRSGLSSTLLTPSNNHLRGGKLPASDPDGPPRRLHLRIHVPKGAPPGQYRGNIKVNLGDQLLHTPLLVDVPDVQLPPVDRPIGLYLERPVHFEWFEETRPDAERAMACDLKFLRHQGITGIAPPLTTPTTAAALSRFIAEIRTTTDAGFKYPVLAYAPFKRLLESLGLEGSMVRLSEVEKALAAEGLPSPVWSIADEPSNPGETISVDKINRYARAFAPRAKLGAQLNHPDDINSLNAFDLVLINEGFGIDQNRVNKAKAAGVTLWLYNLENLRAAAGFYLWRVGAQGYLQWHARMPTADPFDPTDGREDDVQFLYPMAHPCPDLPDVDARLFQLSEGISDLRWLLWLEQRAKQNTQAHKVLLGLRDEIPEEWVSMKNTLPEQLNEWRAAITRLAHDRGE